MSSVAQLREFQGRAADRMGIYVLGCRWGSMNRVWFVLSIHVVEQVLPLSEQTHVSEQILSLSEQILVVE